MASRTRSRGRQQTDHGSEARDYRGVQFSAGRYTGRVVYQGIPLDVGRWPTPQDAAIALDRAILALGYAIPLQVPRVSRKQGPRHPRHLRADARTANTLATSKYLGVIRINNGWGASCTHRYVAYKVSKYKTAREAARAYDRMALYYKGPNCELNFPRSAPSRASQEELRVELRSAKPPRDSKYHGVHLARHVRGRPWQAMAYGPDDRSHFCGMWAREEDAASNCSIQVVPRPPTVAHDRVVLNMYRGEAPVRNFPRGALKPASAKQMRRKAVRQRKESTTSRFLGVYFSRGAWVASIRLREGPVRYLGRFQDEEEAARIRDREAHKHSGPRTKFNFPRKGER